MTRTFKSILFFLLFSLCFKASFSQQLERKTSPIRFLIVSALELGGDEIAEVYFTNGNKQSVRAGQGISLGVGGEFQIPGAERFLLRATAGIKYVTTAADNVHIRLTRIPIVATANYMATSKLRLGAGLSMHRNIRFRTDGLGGDHNFQPANGPIFEIAYAGVGLTYTRMKYKDQAHESHSASAVGLSFSIAVPKK